MISRLISAIAMSALAVNAAVAEPACDYSEKPLSKITPLKIPLADQQIDTVAYHFISISETPNGLAQILVRSSVDLNGIRPVFINMMQTSGQIPASNCNDRYSSGGYFANGTGGNEIVGGFGIGYEKWQCVSADVPCPTWRKPFRFCRKDATTRIAQIGVDVRISLVATMKDGKVLVNALSNTTTGDLSGPLAFVGGFLGSMISGSVGALAGALVGSDLGSKIEERIKEIGDQSLSLPLDLPDLSQTDINQIKNIKFQPIGAAFAGTDNITLDVGHASSEIRPNTACYLEQEIIERSAN